MSEKPSRGFLLSFLPSNVSKAKLRLSSGCWGSILLGGVQEAPVLEYVHDDLLFLIGERRVTDRHIEGSELAFKDASVEELLKRCVICLAYLAECCRAVAAGRHLVI